MSYFCKPFISYFYSIKKLIIINNNRTNVLVLFKMLTFKKIQNNIIDLILVESDTLELCEVSKNGRINPLQFVVSQIEMLERDKIGKRGRLNLIDLVLLESNLLQMTKTSECARVDLGELLLFQIYIGNVRKTISAVFLQQCLSAELRRLSRC